jgi:hypothetical protein
MDCLYRAERKESYPEVDYGNWTPDRGESKNPVKRALGLYLGKIRAALDKRRLEPAEKGQGGEQ